MLDLPAKFGEGAQNLFRVFWMVHHNTNRFAFLLRISRGTQDAAKGSGPFLVHSQIFTESVCGLQINVRVN